MSSHSLLQLAQKIALPRELYAIRHELFEKQQAITKKLWPESKLFTIGSFAIGSALRNSDIDLVLSFPPPKTEKEKKAPAVTDASVIGTPDTPPTATNEPTSASPIASSATTGTAVDPAETPAVDPVSTFPERPPTKRPISHPFATGTHFLRPSFLFNSDLSKNLAPEGWTTTLLEANREQNLYTANSEQFTEVRGIKLLRYNYSNIPGRELSVDLTSQALQPVSLSAPYLREKFSETTGAVEAIMLLKSWCLVNGLAYEWTGGLGNYGLMLSLVAAINAANLDRRTKQTATIDFVLKLWLKYLISDDVRRGTISVHTGKTGSYTMGPKHEYLQNNPNIRRYVSFWDPVERMHSVGKWTARCEDMREMMEKLLIDLEREGPGLPFDKAVDWFVHGDVEAAGLKNSKRDRMLMVAKQKEIAKKGVPNPSYRRVILPTMAKNPKAGKKKKDTK
ncbi:hypothetical protein BZA77DRAFT_312564 [Pyronema omphalodes]|nr:hypothetical protein BZA77DRAFT_312564 [Pyronema omphalodes]